MPEGILLSAVPRGTLLPEAERRLRLEEALPQMHAVLAGETDAVAVEATFACLLWDTLVQANWCGFYRVVGPRTLAVGPYHGAMGCLRIDFARGVCGACATTREIQLVPDVQAFPGHIACDDTTKSELVLPIVSRGILRAVLDLDSPHASGFCRAEADTLFAFVRETFERSDLRW